MNTKLLLSIVGAIVLAGGSYWLGTTHRAEAPALTEEVATTSEATTDVATTTVEREDSPIPAIVTPLLSKPAAQSQPTASPSSGKTAPATPTATVVTYNGRGFSPKEVTILKGGTVRFVNTSDEDMWVASNYHPTHKSYPIQTKNDCLGSAFDMCKSVGKGGSWSFTFTEAGTWRYHNHEKASMDGLVEVNTLDEKPSIPGY